MPRAQRCAARSKRTGQQCRRYAILGGTVCPSHGGRAPQVQAAATARLASLVHPALDALHTVLTSPTASDADKVRSALGVLDRNGLGPSSHIELDAAAAIELGAFDQLSDEQLLRLATDPEHDPNQEG